MDYVLLIALLVGLFLCLLSWLMTTIAGFRHHFITGIIAAVPVLNLLILPTIWHRAKGWFYTGLVGLVLVVGAWFAGADVAGKQFLQKNVGTIKLPWFSATAPTTTSAPSTEKPQTVTQTVNVAVPITPVPTSTTASIPASENAPAPESAQHELPSNALYQMSYTAIDLNNAAQYTGQYVTILRKDQKQVEGKLLAVTDKIVRLEQNQSGQVAPQEIELKYVQNIQVLKP